MVAREARISDFTQIAEATAVFHSGKWKAFNNLTFSVTPYIGYLIANSRFF